MSADGALLLPRAGLACASDLPPFLEFITMLVTNFSFGPSAARALAAVYFVLKLFSRAALFSRGRAALRLFRIYCIK
jgi:hypothetical protein